MEIDHITMFIFLGFSDFIYFSFVFVFVSLYVTVYAWLSVMTLRCIVIVGTTDKKCGRSVMKRSYNNRSTFSRSFSESRKSVFYCIRGLHLFIYVVTFF